MEVRDLATYLIWLAEKRGIFVPSDRVFHDAGIWSPSANAYILDTPGYGQSQLVTCEFENEDGTVNKTSFMPKGGKIPLTAKHIQHMTGLKPIKAAKPAKVATVAKPALPPIEAAPAATPAPMEREPVTMNSYADLCTVAPVAAEPAIVAPAAPAVAPVADDVAMLRATVEALLGRVAALENGTPAAAPVIVERAPYAVRLRMVRAYLSMRAERDHARKTFAEMAKVHAILTDQLEGERADVREMSRQMSSLARELVEARDQLATSEAERLAFAQSASEGIDALREEIAEHKARADGADMLAMEADDRAARLQTRCDALEAHAAASTRLDARPLPVLPTLEDAKAELSGSLIILPVTRSSRRELQEA